MYGSQGVGLLAAMFAARWMSIGTIRIVGPKAPTVAAVAESQRPPHGVAREDGTSRTGADGNGAVSLSGSQRAASMSPRSEIEDELTRIYL